VNALLLRSLAAIAILAGAALIGGSPSGLAETLRVAVPDLPRTRGNPYGAIYTPSSYTWSAIFEALTHIDSTGALVPWVAMSWQQVSPRIWRFRLRDDVVFSNSELLDADAVVAAVEYLRSSRGRNEAVARELSSITGATAIDQFTVDIETAVPNLFLPQELINLQLVAPDQWRRMGPEGFAEEAVGSGPFKVVEWSSGRVALVAHDRAWRRPRVPALEIFAIPQGTARMQALMSRQVDIAAVLGPDDRQFIEESGGRFVSLMDPGVSAMILNNVKDTPFRDVRVRLALQHAVDRQRIVNELLGGATRIATQTAAHTAAGFNEQLQPYSFDPDKARRLLADAGYGHGFNFTFEVPSEDGGIHLVFQQIASDLSEVGVNMTIRLAPTHQFEKNIQDGGWKGEAFQMSYFTGTYDALRPMRNQSCLWQEPWYCDQSIMPRIKQAIVESDLARRMALTREIMAHNHDQAQGLFLYESVSFFGLAPHLSGFKFDAGFIHYNRLSLEGPENRSERH